MFRSLQARLWLTNAIIIGIVVGVSGVMVILFVRSVPIRTNNIRLREVTLLLVQQEELVQSQIFRQESILRNMAHRFSVRILLVNSNGTVLVDSSEGERPPFRPLEIPPKVPRAGNFPVLGTVLDLENRVWQYSVQPLGDDHYIIVTAVRPSFQWLNVFTDDFLPAMLWASGIAVLLAIILSWLTARGVSRPLRAISEATRGVPAGDFNKIEIGGPVEVRQLAESFNSMIDKVKASRQSQQDFVANVSHELKTPLTSIQGFAQAILDGTVGDRQGLEKAAGVIYDEASRMHRLVIALLDLTRLDSGAMAFQRAPVNIALLLENIAGQFSPRAQQAEISLATDIEPVPPAFGDGDRLAQVFQNLLDNAFNHTPAGGTISISARQSGEMAEIRVADSGPGIAPHELERIFERFYQVDKSRARRGAEGSGLGLAIAKEIVEAHGGQIWASSPVTGGSVFVVKMPLG